MSFKQIRALITGIALLTSSLLNSAIAGLITENWQATITYSESSKHPVFDTLSWTVTYDDTANMVHRYGYGYDGVPFTGDDEVIGRYDTPCGLDLSACYIYASDATFDFGNIFNDLREVALLDFGPPPADFIYRDYVNKVSTSADFYEKHYSYQTGNDTFTLNILSDGSAYGYFGVDYIGNTDYTALFFNDPLMISSKYINEVNEPSVAISFSLVFIFLTSRRLRKVTK